MPPRLSLRLRLGLGVGRRLGVFLLALVWILSPVPVLSQSAVLYLKNGDRLSGTIVSETADGVVLKTPYSGNVTLPPDQILRREVPPTPGASAPAAPTNSPSAKPPPAPPAVVPPAAPVVAKTNSFRKFIADWKGELRLGMNLGFSTKDRQTYSGRFQGTHIHDGLKNILDLTGSYGRTEGILSDNQVDGSWRIEHDIGHSKRFHVYNSVGAGYDEIQKIDLRFDVGPGVGYKWIVRTNFVLKTEFGGNYQEQYFSDDTQRKRFSLRLAEEATWQLSNKLKLDEKIEFFPQVENFGEYRIRVESNLSYLLRNNLTLNVTVIDLYDSSAPRSVSNNDLQIRSSIGLKF